MTATFTKPRGRYLTGHGAALLSAGILVLMGGMCALICGAYDISVPDVVRVLSFHGIPGCDGGQTSALFHTVIWEIRLPRVLMALFTGAALSVSGAVFQSCFGNPLAEPYVLGVSSGAAFGAALSITGMVSAMSIQSLAFGFGALAVIIAWFMARVRGETPVVTLILAGIITGSVFSALTGIMKYLAVDGALRDIVFWLMGGFYHASWPDVVRTAPVVMVVLVVIQGMARHLNVLTLGDEQARSLGIHPVFSKLVLVSLATLITALSVSAVGIVAWVGLIVPHAARMVVGPDNRFLLPLSAMLGALYLLACDTLARTLTHAEIPVGIITSILGAPYLFFLIKTKGRTLYGDR